jgi:asparagine synthase (glutamine-hydrolysing)
MCGIIGTNFLSNNFDKSLELLNNRGPDYQNSVKIDNKHFGHTRLAIVDLNV